jgi:hypothetical protein
MEKLVLLPPVFAACRNAMIRLEGAVCCAMWSATSVQRSA